MWIERLDIRGFGMLAGEFAFSPRLTVVVGGNEAGKSTLHDALVRSLFGFSKGERRRQGGPSVRDRRAPWNGGPFAVNAVVHARDGRHLRVEWDFARHEVRLSDADTGEDLSPEVRARGEETTLGERLVGLELEQFREVSAIDQGDIAAVERSDSLVSVLQKAVESGGGDEGVEAADQRLGDFLRDELGVHQSQMRPLAGGLLAELTEAAADLRAKLDECHETRADLAGLAATAAERGAAIARLRRDHLAVEQSALAVATSELEGRLRLVERHARESTSAPPAARRLPAEFGEEIHARLATREQLIASLSAAEEAAAAVQGELAALDAKRRAVQVRLQPLAVYERTDTRLEAALRELGGRREALAAERASLRPVSVSPRDGRLLRFGARRAELTALERRARSTTRLALAASALLVALGAAIGGAIGYSYLYGVTALGLSVALGALAGRSRAARALVGALEELGGASIADLDGRLADEERAVSVAEALAAQHYAATHSLVARKRELDAQADRLLSVADPGGFGSPAERAERYFVACAGAVGWAHVTAELEGLNRRIAELSRAAGEAGSRRSELEAFEREIDAELNRAGVAPGPLDEQFAEVERRLAADAADDEARRRANAALEAMRAALGGESVLSLADRTAQAAARLGDHMAAWERIDPVAGDAGQLDAEATALAGRIRALELEVAAIEARIAERERGTGDPAALEEELARIERRLARVETVRDAVALAREHLRAAARDAHRQFAPHLNRALEQFLPAVTSGRYREAVVGDDLGIQVHAPETGRLVPADTLSRGTRDQIYLIERIQMVRLLDPQTGGAPLLLDDPFARFDTDRLECAMALLADVARERQVIIFSEDRSLVDLARRSDPPAAIIELPAPPGSLTLDP